MEIDKKQLQEFILWFWGIMEQLESNLLAYQVVFTLLKSTGQFPELDGMLENARKHPSPKLQARHKEMRETIEKLLTEENPADALMTFLREWKPRGPIQ